MQRLRDNLYVLVEFPEDSSYFEENDIGYPSFNSEDNGARYVPQRNYIDHFKKDPEPNDQVDTLNEPISDEKGLADFGEQAVWVPFCNIKKPTT